MKEETINHLFDYCVQLLIDVAPMLGMTYNEINIYLFVILQPVLILLFFLTTLYYKILVTRKAVRVKT